MEPISLTHEPLMLTWNFQVQVTDAPDSGHRRGPTGTGNALLDSPLPTDLHGKWAPCKNREGPCEQPRAQAWNLQKTQALGGEETGDCTYRAHARQRIWWRRCKPQARWGSRRPCRCHLPGPLSGCPLCWGLPRPKICRHNLQHSSPRLL